MAWANLSPAQQTALQSGDSVAAGQARLAWVSGNDTANSTYEIRNRIIPPPTTAAPGTPSTGSLIGDIVNSDPAFAGTNSSHYEFLSVALGGSSYADPIFDNKNVEIARQEVILLQKIILLYVTHL